MERLLTSKEAAEYLNIHPKTLAAHARKGKVPAIHMGGRWRFRVSELNQWLDKQKVMMQEGNEDERQG